MMGHTMSEILHINFCNIPKHEHYTQNFPFDLRCESDNYTTMYMFTACRCVSELKDKSVQ